MSLVVTDCTEQLERRLEIFSNLTDRSQVATPVAVVGGTPHGHDVLVGEMVFVALVHQLMGTGNQGEVIDMAELVSHSVTKEPS